MDRAQRIRTLQIGVGAGIAAAAIIVLLLLFSNVGVQTTPKTPPLASTAPSVSSAAATALGYTGATLNGNLRDLGSASSVTVGFLYGTSPTLAGALNATVRTQTSAGAFNETVTGLAASSTYYVRAWAKGDGFAAGAILPFSTRLPGNGHQVPPGWAHAACSSLGPPANGHGEVARCLFSMTYGEMHKLGLTGAVAQAPSVVGSVLAAGISLAGTLFIPLGARGRPAGRKFQPRA